jgi:hypothetical protein
MKQTLPVFFSVPNRTVTKVNTGKQQELETGKNQIQKVF